MALSKQTPVVAVHLSQYLVASHELQFGEYVFAIKPTDYVSRRHFHQLITALLNTSSGVIIIDLEIPLESKDSDKWLNNMRDQLLKFMPQAVYTDRISVYKHRGFLHMLVHKSKQFITTESFLFTRGAGAETVAAQYQQDITQIQCQDVVQGDTMIFPRIGPFTYMGTCPYSETKNLEFKCYTCSTITDIFKRLDENRTTKTVLAMANLSGGGEIILGIKEQSSQKVYIGQEVPDKEKFLEMLTEWLQKDSSGSRRAWVWGELTEVPLKDNHWSCDFIPLDLPPCNCQPTCKFCPHMTPRYIVCLKIFQCPGGVFQKRPESFTIADNGEVIGVSFEDWKHQHGQHAETKSTTQAPHAGSPPVPPQAVSPPVPPQAVSLRVPQEAVSPSIPPQAESPPIPPQVVSPPVPPEAGEPTSMFEDEMTISFTKHSSRAQIHEMGEKFSTEHMTNIGIFKPACPVHCTPSTYEIEHYVLKKTGHNLPDAMYDDLNKRKGFGIADETLYSCMTHDIQSLPPANHTLDLLVLSNISKIFLFVVCATFGNEVTQLMAYTMVLSRLIKKKILHHTKQKDHSKSLNIVCKIVSLDGTNPQTSPDYYHRWFSKPPHGSFADLSLELARILSQVKTHFRDKIYLSADLNASVEQSQTLLAIQNSRFNIIEGPPGCGKTLLARHVCEKYGRENAAYISACVALNARVGASGEVDVFDAVDSSQILSVLQRKLTNKTHVVIDDNHNYAYTDKIAQDICETIACKDMMLYVFQDSQYQNYKDQIAPQALQQTLCTGKYGSYFIKALTEIRRNSQVVGSFLKAQISSGPFSDYGNEFKCVGSVAGDDILIKHVANLHKQGEDNGLLQHIKQLLANPKNIISRRCTSRDIAVLVDDQQVERAEEDVRNFKDLFQKFLQDIKVHGAKVYPVEGVIIDTLSNFSGLETKVVVFVMPRSSDDRPEAASSKYRIAVASRGILRVDFLREDNLDVMLADSMACDRCPSNAVIYEPNLTDMASSKQLPVLVKPLSHYLVASKHLEFGEYLFGIKLTDVETERDFCQIICALLNTSGGVIIVDLGVPLESKSCDSWKSNLVDRLNFLPPDVYNNCIALHELNGFIYIVVHKAKEFITTNSFMFNRTPGAASVLVRHHQGISTILSQDVIEGEARIFPLRGPYSYMQSCPMAETQNLEFKWYSCRKVNDLIAKLQEVRVEKTIVAMGNVPGGGEIIIGIKEPDTPSTSKQTKGKQTPHNISKPTQSSQNQPQITHIKGQELLTTEEDEFITELEKHLKNASGNSKRIWGDATVVPLRGTHWDCEFISLGLPPYACQPSCHSCPHLTRRVLVRIRIFQCPGGLFAKRPDSFTLTDDGEVVDVPFEDWKRKHSKRKGKDMPEHTETPVLQLPIRKTIQSPTVEAPTDITEKTAVFKDGMILSFKEHSSWSEEKTDIFESAAPVHFTPSRDEIENYLSFKNKKNFPQEIDEELSGQEGFGIADYTLFDCIEHGVTSVSFKTAQQSTSFKIPNHVMDLLVVTNIPRIFLFVICSTVDNWLIEYTMVLARVIKNKLLQRMSSAADYKAINIICKIVSLDGTSPQCSPEYYHRWFTNPSSRNLNYITKALASILSQVQTHFRDTIHLGADLSLSQEQMQALLVIDINRFNVIEGAPGCGKTLLARHVCEKHGRETSAYISACVALNARVGASGEVDVFFAADSSQILSLLQGELKDKTHIVIDDNHNYAYTDDLGHEICETIAKSKMFLYVFQNSRYQNYKDDTTCNNLLIILSGQNYGTVCIRTLTEVRRNSQMVGFFLKAQVSSLVCEEECNYFKCVSALKGDDIVIKHIANLRAQSKENGLVKHIKQLVINPLNERSKGRTFSDIAVLIDHPEEATAVEATRKYRELFKNVWPDSKPQGAEVYPVEGVIVDTLTHFAGLESKVVVFVMPPSTDTPETDIDTKHRIAVASRGIERVDFVREENLDLAIAKHMRCDQYPQCSLKASKGANQ